MSGGYARWSEVRAKGREADPRTADEQTAGKVTARERREAYVRGHQLAEMRAAAGLTQAELADALGMSQARISKIEHGEISGVDVVRAYVAALGGSVDVVARLGDRQMESSRTGERRRHSLQVCECSIVNVRTRRFLTRLITT